MRIVKNLEHINECPNCTGHSLILTKNEFGRPFKQCCICTEEIYEDEDTQYEPINVGKAPDDIDDTLMDIEYELGQLTLWAHDKHSLDQLEAIKSILEQFLSVIRRMK